MPPVLEIYVIWHPGDIDGLGIAQEFVDHFHGTVFSGLIGGGIEVYARSAGWQSADDAPRPVPVREDSSPYGVQQAQFLALVPVLGNRLSAAVQTAGPWQSYIRELAAAQAADSQRVGLFPYLLDGGAIDGTVLGQVFGKYHRIAANAVGDGDTVQALRCRDLSQGMAQLLARTAGERLTAFISHTKRSPSGEEENVESLISTVRDLIRSTHLREFFDASDLQPGQDWELELRDKAATSALLAIRTDLYPSREWCQREMMIAKREGMPVIIIDALGEAEERGSFLMDHVPRVPARLDERGRWRKTDVYRALNLLVDECLKRALWRRQEELARRESLLPIAWWAPHAPEPITLAKWLDDERQQGRLGLDGEYLIILHPDPPLGAEEKAVLQEMLSFGGVQRRLDVMTPRLLAARAG